MPLGYGGPGRPSQLEWAASWGIVGPDATHLSSHSFSLACTLWHLVGPGPSHLITVPGASAVQVALAGGTERPEAQAGLGPGRNWVTSDQSLAGAAGSDASAHAKPRPVHPDAPSDSENFQLEATRILVRLVTRIGDS